MEEKVDIALDDLRTSLRSDGADLKVEKVEKGTAYLSLILNSESCEECILPKDVLESVTVSSLQNYIPEIKSVVLNDPR